MAASLSPVPGSGAARDSDLPLDMERDLLLRTRTCGCPASSMAAADLLLARFLCSSLPLLWLRARLTAVSTADGSIPMPPSSLFMRVAVRLLSTSAAPFERGITAAFVPNFFFLLCSLMSFVFLDRIAASVSASSSVRCSSSISSATGALAANSSSSRSRASSLASISGSMKSAMLCPSQISGMMSYFHASSSRSHRFLTSCEYTPAPPCSSWRSFSVFLRSPASRFFLSSSTPEGMHGGRDTVSRCLGIATWSRSATSCTRLLLSFISTRLAKSRSQAIVLTLLTPSSVSVLIGTSTSLRSVVNATPAAAPADTLAASCPIFSRICLWSSVRSSTCLASILFITTITGLLAKSGQME
mmetsp:Transcript_7775/g.21170  ORF Transcript_7775/g.21170 Transcript_7775/m.21170 type:complete len:358 (-) Transcript_7775:1048-2121(-)